MTKARDLSQIPNASLAFRNRIINGAMMIDQRNAGASVTVNGDIYTLDRWKVFQSAAGRFSVQQNAGSVVPPAGFTNYLGVTSLAATTPTSGQYFLVDQWIEGFNVADLGWGGSNAQPITLSFWVRSSVTGTHSGAIGNHNYGRSYAFVYTVSSANTWEYKTITIPGDTTGSWLTSNGTGISLRFAMSIGSGRATATPNVWNAFGTDGAQAGVNVLAANGNTWYITGVQLERGSTATSFDYRPYGTELALCQRYCFVMNNTDSVANRYALGFSNSTTKGYVNTPHPVPMRTKPSLTSTSASTFQLSDTSAGTVLTAISIQSVTSDVNKTSFDCTTASGLTAYRPYYLEPYVGVSSITLSAEL